MADRHHPTASLLRAIASRLLGGLLSLLFISLVTFMANEFSPGDAATARAGEKATAAQVQRIRHEMGLDRPWPIRYVEFVGKAARLDFGESYFSTREPVGSILLRALPMTLKLAGFSIVLATVVGVTLGVLAAVSAETWFDRAVLSFSTLGVTVPNFVLAPILVYLLAVKGNYLPTTWEVNLRAPEFYYWILPVVVLSARTTATLTRLTRASMLETLGQEFIRFATAKGLPKWRVVVVHGLRNALLPVLTAVGTNLGYLLTGSFVVETIFTMPGLGFIGIDAILKSDTPVILGTTLLAGSLFVIVNLLVDLALPLLDPRIRESQGLKKFGFLFWVGVGFLVLLVLYAIVGPNLHHSWRDPSGFVKLPPSPDHLLGTDELGRDVFARLAYGARLSLMISILVQVVAVTVGVFVGVTGVFGPKWISAPLMRLTDGMFAFPDLLLAIMLVGLFGRGTVPVVSSLAVASWPSVARLVRSLAAGLKGREFVVAARAMGASIPYVVTRHVLPHLAGVVLAVAMVDVAATMLSESTLSFLGIGVQLPETTWGGMIQGANLQKESDPLLLLWPCLALSSTVFVINFVGDGLRRALDPTRSHLR